MELVCKKNSNGTITINAEALKVITMMSSNAVVQTLKISSVEEVKKLAELFGEIAIALETLMFEVDEHVLLSTVYTGLSLVNEHNRMNNEEDEETEDETDWS